MPSECPYVYLLADPATLDRRYGGQATSSAYMEPSRRNPSRS